MLEIDGSYGEGGGQIVRYAAALATHTQTPIHITNIRANRPNPGLRPQHYAALHFLEQLCNAETKNINVGSEEVTFKPGTITPGSYSYDIGTAGSITLVYQACLLAVQTIKKPLKISLIGGTDVRWAPSWDYFTHVFLPTLKHQGLATKSHLIQRGYYPKGGGQTELTINPVNQITSRHNGEEPQYDTIKGLIHYAHLPDHIPQRIKHAIQKYAVKHDLQITLEIEHNTTPISPGTGVTLWSCDTKGCLGASHPGERGIRAEELGITVITELHHQIENAATLDIHLFDQLLPYMVLSGKTSSCRVSTISNHAKTSMWLLKKFFDVEFNLTAEETYVNVVVKKHNIK
jgi:RNA 3'-phosphate cyclase